MGLGVSKIPIYGSQLLNAKSDLQTYRPVEVFNIHSLMFCILPCPTNMIYVSPPIPSNLRKTSHRNKILWNTNFSISQPRCAVKLVRARVHFNRSWMIIIFEILIQRQTSIQITGNEYYSCKQNVYSVSQSRNNCCIEEAFVLSLKII